MPHLFWFVNKADKPQACGKISLTQLKQQHCSIALLSLWLLALIATSPAGDRQQEFSALIQQV